MSAALIPVLVAVVPLIWAAVSVATLSAALGEEVVPHEPDLRAGESAEGSTSEPDTTEPGLAPGFYVGLNGFATLPLNTDQDNIETRNAASPGLSLVLGAQIGRSLRTEIELGWRHADIHGYGDESADGDVNTVPLLANLWLSPPVDGWPSWLYAGGGLGGAYERIDGSNGSLSHEPRQSDEFEFAWQAGGGVRVPVTEALTIDLGVRYLETTGVTEQVAGLLGLSVRFP